MSEPQKSRRTPPHGAPDPAHSIDEERLQDSSDRKQKREVIRLTIGYNCYLLRTARRETQAQVAVAIGLDEKSYSNIERGIRAPRYDTLQALAQHFNVTYNDILGDVAGPQGGDPNAAPAGAFSNLEKASPEEKTAAFNDILRICARFLR